MTKKTEVKKEETKKTAKKAAPAKAEPGKPCSVSGCKRPYRAKGYCTVHFHKWRRGELEAKPRYRTCEEEKCNKKVFKGGYCEQHYTAWLASKRPEAPKEAPSAADAPKVEAAQA